ncbi:MAG: heme exporter protein CcmD [Rhodocyclaceae bacterium]|nr:heme exporter protein CcmD [Rhodocyclaceae bacterium]MCB1900805.1 heme exporter protein CcmD [Rhodocyclaceae bacterium]
MNWESAAAFWDMGGAASFVWGSYAVTLIAILVELILLFQRRKSTVNRLQRLRRGRSSRRQPANESDSQ